MIFGIVAIAKNEPIPLVREWLHWHRQMGVNRFFIYDNGGWSEHGAHDTIIFPVYQSFQQINCYNHCLQTYRNDLDFLAAIDLDEFLMGDVLERLESGEVENSLCLNWKVYGTSGLQTNPRQHQMGIFKWHMPAFAQVSNHIKSIIRPRRTLFFEGSHHARHVDDGTQQDCTGHRFRGPFNPITEYPSAWINHYVTRSMDWWKLKVERGRASSPRCQSVDEVRRTDSQCTVLEGTDMDTTRLRKLMKRTEFPLLFSELGLNVGVEVGTFRGDFALHILRIWSGKLFCVDQWKHQDVGYDDASNVSNGEFEAMYREVQAKLEPFGATLIRMSSVDAARQFADGSLDWVYIDANHSREAVEEDLNAWWSKVRSGGIVAGHDYMNGETRWGTFGVKSAVDEFLLQWGMTPKITTEEAPSWYVRKP